LAVPIQAGTVAGLSDKEDGLRQDSMAEIRRYIFPYPKFNGDLLSGRTRETIFRAIRPTGNVLDGYVTSYAFNRVLEEAA